MNDPWATDPPRITAHQVSQIVELIADYTTAEATELIVSLATRSTGSCGACGQSGDARHSRICPTQGRD